jgi:hypothetical protein
MKPLTRVLLSLFVHLVFSSLAGGRSIGGMLLNAALDHVIGPQRTHNKETRTTPQIIAGLPVTTIRLQCDNSKYLACGNSTPTIEILNPVVLHGTIYFNHPDQQSLDIINQFATYFEAVPNRLPSCLGTIPRGGQAWLPGPRYVIINDTNRPLNAPKKCGQTVAAWAHFLFAWGHTNAFHALNENVFKVISSLILQRYFHADLAVKPSNKATLYVFDVSATYVQYICSAYYRNVIVGVQNTWEPDIQRPQ